VAHGTPGVTFEETEICDFQSKVAEMTDTNQVSEPPLTPKPEKPLVHSLVQADRLMQIALVLPIAVLIGWFFGSLLDRWLHQTWISVVGLVLGMIAGMIEAVRMALAAGKPRTPRKP
jgi:ATP synthase protein I